MTEHHNTRSTPHSAVFSRTTITVAAAATLALALVSVALVAVVALGSRAIASGYDQALEHYRSVWSDDALASLAAVQLSTEFDTDYSDENQSAEVITAIADQCPALVANEDLLADFAAAPPPTLASPPFAELVPGYGETTQRDEAFSNERASARALLDSAPQAVVRLRGACESIAETFAINAAWDSDFDQFVAPYVVVNGSSETADWGAGPFTFDCTDEFGCYPIGEPARTSYGEGMQKVRVNFGQSMADYFDTNCPLPEMSDYCAAGSDYWMRYVEISTDFAAQFTAEVPRTNEEHVLPQYTAWRDSVDEELSDLAYELDNTLADIAPGLFDQDGSPPTLYLVQQLGKAETTLDSLTDDVVSARG